MLRLLVVTTLAACNLVFPLNDPGGSDGGLPSEDASPDAIPGHDEDQDDNPDVSDNCPNVPNKDQLDSDRDDVGDACDPRPTIKGDRLAFFDPFTGFDGNRWSVVAGDWVVETDRIEQQKSNTVTPESYLLQYRGVDGVRTLNRPTIELVIEEVASKDGGGFFVTGPGIEAIPAFPAGVSCYVEEPDGSIVYFEHRSEASGFGTSTKVALPVMGEPIRLTMQPQGAVAGGPRCIAQRELGTDNERSVVSNPNEVPEITTAGIGIYVFASAAAFRSIAVYDIVP